jgi:hypothetical protein
MRRTTAGNPRPAEAGDGAATSNDTPIADRGSDRPAWKSQRRSAARLKPTRADAGREPKAESTDEPTGGGIRFKAVIVKPIEVFPGPRTAAQEAALAAFWRAILARAAADPDRD